MHHIMRKRLWRKLETLPDQRLYQVLDYIEFLESRYGDGAQASPSGFQQFAERVEDRMRARRLAPRLIGGAMATLGAAGRVLDAVAGAGRGVADAGRELLDSGARAGARRAPAAPRRSRPARRRSIPIE